MIEKTWIFAKKKVDCLCSPIDFSEKVVIICLSSDRCDIHTAPIFDHLGDKAVYLGLTC